VPPVERGAAMVFRLAVDNLLSLIGGEAPKVTELLVQPRIVEASPCDPENPRLAKMACRQV